MPSRYLEFDSSRLTGNGGDVGAEHDTGSLTLGFARGVVGIEGNSGDNGTIGQPTLISEGDRPRLRRSLLVGGGMGDSHGSTATKFDPKGEEKRGLG